MCFRAEDMRQRATRSRAVGGFKVRLMGKHSNSVGACGHEEHGERSESPANSEELSELTVSCGKVVLFAPVAFVNVKSES